MNRIKLERLEPIDVMGVVALVLKHPEMMSGGMLLTTPSGLQTLVVTLPPVAENCPPLMPLENGADESDDETEE